MLPMTRMAHVSLGAWFRLSVALTLAAACQM